MAEHGQRTDVMRMTFVEHMIYEDLRATQGHGEYHGEPQGTPLYRGPNAIVFENGVSAWFGVFSKITDEWTHLPGGPKVVFEKWETFVPMDMVTAIYPVEYRLWSVHSHREDGFDLRHGVQFETSDMTTCIAQLRERRWEDDLRVLEDALGPRWTDLFWWNETLHGEVRQRKSQGRIYQVVSGDLYKPWALRNAYGEPRQDFEGERFGGLPPDVEVMRDLATEAMDPRTFMEWAEYFALYLARTWRELRETLPAGEGGGEPSNPLVGNEWYGQRLQLLEHLARQLGRAEAAWDRDLPVSPLYRQIGEELMADQFVTGRGDGGDDDATRVVPLEVDEGRCRLALEMVDKAMRTSPYGHELLVDKMLAHRVLGDEDRAEGYLTAAARVRALWSDGQMERVRDLLDEGRHKKALRVIRRLERQNPGVTELVYLRGLLLRDLGDGRGALEAFETCLEMEPEHLLAQYGRGLALEALGRRDEAAGCFERV